MLLEALRRACSLGIVTRHSHRACITAMTRHLYSWPPMAAKQENTKPARVAGPPSSPKPSVPADIRVMSARSPAQTSHQYLPHRTDLQPPRSIRHRGVLVSARVVRGAANEFVWFPELKMQSRLTLAGRKRRLEGGKYRNSKSTRRRVDLRTHEERRRRISLLRFAESREQTAKRSVLHFCDPTPRS